MPLSRGLAEARHDGCLASFPPKTGDRAGLAPPRRSNLASVAVELIHDSRQEDGCGRLGNYSDCLKQDREKYTLLARGSRLAATAIKRASKSISRVMQISSAAFSDRSEVATHDRASTTPCRMAA